MKTRHVLPSLPRPEATEAAEHNETATGVQGKVKWRTSDLETTTLSLHCPLTSLKTHSNAPIRAPRETGSPSSTSAKPAFSASGKKQAAGIGRAAVPQSIQVRIRRLGRAGARPLMNYLVQALKKKRGLESKVSSGMKAGVSGIKVG